MKMLGKAAKTTLPNFIESEASLRYENADAKKSRSAVLPALFVVLSMFLCLLIFFVCATATGIQEMVIETANAEES